MLQPVRWTAKELDRKETREVSNRIKHSPGKFLTALTMVLLSELVTVLAEGRETCCILCVGICVLYKFLSVPDTEHQLKNDHKSLHSKQHCFI